MRSMLVGVVAAAAIVAFPGVSPADPAVDMQAVLMAAQIDPQRPDQAVTPGSKGGVTLVEQALHDEGLLDEKWVDGSFGTSTVAAYRAYQESLGYSGLDANGLPGVTSLKELGTDRFTVQNAVTPGDRVSYQGKTVNTRTRDMLAEAERKLDRDLVLDQGSYNPGGDPTSAGTGHGECPGSLGGARLPDAVPVWVHRRRQHPIRPQSAAGRGLPEVRYRR
ncbi:MAG: hypothetical protein GEV10_02580 [Streptosporangiales bacterium]|nr:hypothetical protein [Streptosporangiales bacterium]